MQTTFICKSCGLHRPRNLRLKGSQLYCGAAACQRERKRAWQKEKMATDPRYREPHLRAQKRWRRRRPAHRYQAQYRQSHSRYVEKNREQQRRRNDHRRKPTATDTAPDQLIVKMDALADIKSGTYLLTPYVSTKIVKMDAFVVQLQLLQAIGRPPLASSC